MCFVGEVPSFIFLEVKELDTFKPPFHSQICPLHGVSPFPPTNVY